MNICRLQNNVAVNLRGVNKLLMFIVQCAFLNIYGIVDPCFYCTNHWCFLISKHNNYTYITLIH